MRTRNYLPPLGDVSTTNGDGLLLSGHTLDVVQNALNQVAVVSLDAGHDRPVPGEVTGAPRAGRPARRS